MSVKVGDKFSCIDGSVLEVIGKHALGGFIVERTTRPTHVSESWIETEMQFGSLIKIDTDSCCKANSKEKTNET